MGTLTCPIQDSQGNVTNLVINISVNSSVPGASDRYVTKAATGSGDGTQAKPWTMAQACAMNGAKAGNTVWLDDGDYRTTGQWRFLCSGGPGSSKITFRSLPGKWASLSSAEAGRTTPAYYDAMVYVESPHIIFRDIEAFFVFSTRQHPTWTSNDGPGPNAMDCYGIGCDLINLLVHDGTVAIGHWANNGYNNTNAQVYGCVTYNNGQHGGDRTHGQSMYIQNQQPSIRTIRHNIAINSMEAGITSRSANNFTDKLRIQENIVCTPSSQRDQSLGGNGAPGILFYDINNKMFDNQVDGNIVYVLNNSKFAGSMAFQHYYGDTGCADLYIRDNWLYCDGCDSVIQNSENVDLLTMTGNDLTLRNPQGGGRVFGEGAPSGNPKTRKYGTNKYRIQQSDPRFALTRWTGSAPVDYAATAGPTAGSPGFDQWKADTGDVGSTCEYGVSVNTPDYAKLIPNEHEKGRANIAVHNGNAKAATVKVNCDAILATGDVWYLYNAANPKVAVATGTYVTGAGINVPMTAPACGLPARPIGSPVDTPPTQPIFGVYIVRRVGPNWVAPPLALAV